MRGSEGWNDLHRRKLDVVRDGRVDFRSHGAGGQGRAAWVCALMQRINMMPINTLLLCLHFPRYFLRSGTNHRLASYFARLIGAMQVTHGSCSILLGMEVAPVLSSALVVLIQIYTLIDCFPHALGVVGTEGHFRRMRAQNGPSPACFAPLAIYADARCLTPLRPLHMVQRRSPKGPPKEPSHFVLAASTSFNLPARRPIVSSHLPATRRNRQAFVATEGIERRYNLPIEGLMSPL